MTAHRDDAACTGAGVRKPPGKETAGRDTGGWGALWRFEREGLWDLRGLTRFPDLCLAKKLARMLFVTAPDVSRKSSAPVLPWCSDVQSASPETYLENHKTILHGGD
jgi:hypothetical protein